MTTRAHKGRGAVSAPLGRFEKRPVELDPDAAHEKAAQAPQTVLRAMRAGQVISTNSSPDIPFDRSINPSRAASTVAFIAMRDLATATWIFRPVSI